MIKKGFSTYLFRDVYISDFYSACGPFEYKGMYGSYFNKHYDSLYLGEKSFEKAEMTLLKSTVEPLIDKNDKIHLAVLGDLNNQIAISSYLMKEYKIPYLGIYSACATFIESIIIGSMFVENNLNNTVLCGSCSHNATSERQFRTPNEYGGQKPSYFTFTSTAAGSCILKNKGLIKVTSCTIGKVNDYNQMNAFDLPRSMAPACADTLIRYLKDSDEEINSFDLIVTGDLSLNGSKIFLEILEKHGIDINDRHFDCGEKIYDIENQPVYSGGSGAGCIAGMLCAYIFKKILDGTYKKIIVLGTGALLNPIMVSQKESIPSISHLIVLEGVENAVC